MDKIVPDSSCWLVDSQVWCEWRADYTPIDIKIEDKVYRLKDGDYVDKCYFSVKYWKTICELKISICPHGNTYLGWPFLSNYPVKIFSNGSQTILSNSVDNNRENIRLGYFTSII
jgi:hypothetical protein